MGHPRFFATGQIPESGVLPLTGQDIHHLRDVLRLRAGETIELAFSGEVWTVRLDEVSGPVAGVRRERIAGAMPLPRVTLAQALLRSEKMDAVVRQAAELGVSRIVPFAAERSVVRLDPGKASARAERWRRIAEGAAKQAHLTGVPEVAEPVETAGLAEALEGTLMLLAWEEADSAPGIAEAIESAGGSASGGVSVIVGPEGGISRGEAELLTGAGAWVVTLGPTVLRTETAGVVASAIAVHALGGLGAHRG